MDDTIPTLTPDQRKAGVRLVGRKDRNRGVGVTRKQDSKASRKSRRKSQREARRRGR